jgi:hypothetical protein
VAVGEDGVDVEGRGAGGAALQDGEQQLLVIACDADEASETSLDDLEDG